LTIWQRTILFDLTGTKINPVVLIKDFLNAKLFNLSLKSNPVWVTFQQHGSSFYVNIEEKVWLLVKKIWTWKDFICRNLSMLIYDKYITNSLIITTYINKTQGSSNQAKWRLLRLGFNEVVQFLSKSEVSTCSRNHWLLTVWPTSTNKNKNKKNYGLLSITLMFEI
jgi:hypothetical protein